MKKIIASSALCVLLCNAQTPNSCTTCALEGKCWHNVPGTSTYTCDDAGTALSYIGGSNNETIWKNWYADSSNANGGWYQNYQYYCHRTEFDYSTNYGTAFPMKTTSFAWTDGWTDGKRIINGIPDWASNYTVNYALWEQNQGDANWMDRNHYAGAAGGWLGLANDGQGSHLMPNCVKFTNCLAPQEYYTWVQPVSVQATVFVQPEIPTVPINGNWSEPWNADFQDIKTWRNFEDQWTNSNTGHEIQIEWTERNTQKYYVENDTYCVGTVVNNLKDQMGWRNEIDSYDQTRYPQNYVWDAHVEFKNVSEGIKIFYTDNMRHPDWELWKEWDEETLTLRERIETKSSDIYKWSGDGIKWLAVNTAPNAGSFVIQWQGAAQLVAGAIASMVALQL